MNHYNNELWQEKDYYNKKIEKKNNLKILN